MDYFQNFLRKCETFFREEDIDEMDEILRTKRKMIVDIEELIEKFIHIEDHKARHK